MRELKASLYTCLGNTRYRSNRRSACDSLWTLSLSLSIRFRFGLTFTPSRNTTALRVSISPSPWALWVHTPLVTDCLVIILVRLMWSVCHVPDSSFPARWLDHLQEGPYKEIFLLYGERPVHSLRGSQFSGILWKSLIYVAANGFKSSRLLSFQASAEGELYIDDFHSFNYEKKEFIHRRLSFSDGTLTSRWICALSFVLFKAVLHNLAHFCPCVSPPL